MEIDRKELKRRAREAMGLARPRFWVVALVYFLMTTGLSYLTDWLVPLLAHGEAAFTLSLFCSLLMSLYLSIVQFSYTLWALWTGRRMDPGLGTLLQGFSVAGRVIWMEALIYLRILGWSALLGVLVISPLVYLLLMGSALLAPLLLLVIGGMYAAIWAIMLRYALAPYLLADSPDAGAAAAVRRSADLMRGWKWELFKLEFSFVGWSLLSLLLSTLVTAAALWQAGFFQAVAALPAEELPDLVTNFSIWRSGTAADLLEVSQAQIELFELYSSASGSLWATLLADLATLPVFLWLTPYRAVALAGFYDARIRLQRENIPPL